MNNTNRNDKIDILRGICVVLILITHFNLPVLGDEERLKLLFPFWVEMAVPTFMFISGYVNAFSYKKSGISTFAEAYTYKNMVKKIARLIVPFSLFFIVEMPLLCVFYRSYSISELIFAYFQGGVGQGSYYVPVMIQFVCFFPVIYFVIKKNTKRGLIILAIANFAFEILKSAYLMNVECYRLLFFRYLFVAAWGAFVALEGKQKSKALTMILFFLGVAYILVVSYFKHQFIVFSYWPETSMITAFYIVPILMLFINNTLDLKLIVLRNIGRASYNIYLVQMLFYIAVKSPIVGNVISYISAPRIVLLLVCVCICLCVGYIFFLIEQPVTKKITQFLYTIY